MAQVYWAPKNIFRKMKVVVTVGGTITTETFTISIGGLTFATFTASSSTAAQVCAGLVAYWNSTSGTYYQHPWKTMTIADNLDGTITFEATTAGVVYLMTLNTPGGSATFSKSTTVSNLSPNDVSVVTNWSGGALPTTSDDVKVPAGTPDMLWNLDAITATIDDWHFEPGCGKIGLPAETFQLTPTSIDSTVAEYRTTFLTCKGSDHLIGQSVQLGLQSAWPVRLKLDTSNVAANIQNYSNAAQVGLHPPVQIKANHSSTVIHNYGADVGVGEDLWGDTTTISKAYNYMPNSRMRVGFNVTVATLEFDAGAKGILGSYPTSELRLAAGANVEAQAAGTIAKVRGPGTITKRAFNVVISAIE